MKQHFLVAFLLTLSMPYAHAMSSAIPSVSSILDTVEENPEVVINLSLLLYQVYKHPRHMLWGIGTQIGFYLLQTLCTTPLINTLIKRPSSLNQITKIGTGIALKATHDVYLYEKSRWATQPPKQIGDRYYTSMTGPFIPFREILPKKLQFFKKRFMRYAFKKIPLLLSIFVAPPEQYQQPTAVGTQ